MKDNYLKIILALTALIGVYFYMNIPKSIRNNNAGNIRKSKDNWLGSIGDDGAFVIFSEAKYGFRALAKLLFNYQSKYNLLTIRQLINRYAPHSENPTDSYVDFVADIVGVKPDEAIRVLSHLPKLLEAVGRFEAGTTHFWLGFSQSDIGEGIALL